MSDDLFADWKRNRFIVAGSDLTESNNHIIVLTDIKFWAEHADALAEWCERNQGAYPQGMTVEISDDKTLTHFILRWS